jgi:hypothetical protein
MRQREGSQAFFVADERRSGVLDDMRSCLIRVRRRSSASKFLAAARTAHSEFGGFNLSRTIIPSENSPREAHG